MMKVLVGGMDIKLYGLFLKRSSVMPAQINGILFSQGHWFELQISSPEFCDVYRPFLNQRYHNKKISQMSLFSQINVGKNILTHAVTK